MCGRYVLKREDLERAVERVAVRTAAFHSRYNIAPTSVVPAFRAGGTGGAELVGLRWGLIPARTRPDESPKPIVNLRAETVLTRFKSAAPTRRCVLPASGFYEWQAATRQPWYFHARADAPLGLAGLWDAWQLPDGSALETCTILTTTPNEVVRPIHERMPVLLPEAQWSAWLDRSLDLRQAEALLGSAPADLLVATRVGQTVNSVRNDGPDCIAPAGDTPPQDEPQLSLGF